VKSPDVDNIAAHAVDRLELSPEAKQEIKGIQAELLEGYQESFVEMVNSIARQASALERLQNTLNLLIEHIAPELATRVPVALRVAGPEEVPDLASAVVLADPIAAGYTLTQTRIAEALGISSSDVSILVRAFAMNNDGECAVTVRKGQKVDVVNYHPRAIARFREHVANPPARLSKEQKHALERVRRLLLLNNR
jgi:hypothetical protein